jgi:hypothetical protein
MDQFGVGVNDAFLAEVFSVCLDGAHLLPLVRAGTKFVDRVQGDRAKNVTQSTENVAILVKPIEFIYKKSGDRNAWRAVRQWSPPAGNWTEVAKL